jgi:thioredoxin reductase
MDTKVVGIFAAEDTVFAKKRTVWAINMSHPKFPFY